MYHASVEFNLQSEDALFCCERTKGEYFLLLLFISWTPQRKRFFDRKLTEGAKKTNNPIVKMTCLMHLGSFSASTRYCLSCIRLSQKRRVHAVYKGGRQWQSGFSTIGRRVWQILSIGRPRGSASCTLALMQLAHSCFSCAEKFLEEKEH